MAPSEPDLTFGISRSLAAARARTLERITCDLTLDLPADPDGPILGRVILACALTGPPQPLVIDFAPGLDRVAAISVNGRPSRASAVNDHLIVPHEELRGGANTVSILFRAGDGLHRDPALTYSLFVPARAHAVFPCFDQPDLKTRFSLTLTLPRDWQALSNGPAVDRSVTGDRACVRFAETAPLPTYVFAFAAGNLGVDVVERRGRSLQIFHREHDSARLARNRETIVDLHASALSWLEAYTGAPYAFGKLDVLLVPSFEFRGMEHAGAIFYDAGALLLDEAPTEDQVLARAQLIAHETTHMWFGNLVTMRWFDDVWLKEVFANLLAGKIVAPAFPRVNHDLRFFATHYPAAYAVERTAGSHPIRQPLENLEHAKDLYGAIIYHKAPIVMRALERQIGADRLRDALGHHLRTRAFGNADWDDLRADLQSAAGIDLESWSRQWIEEPGRAANSVAAPGPGDSFASMEAVLSGGGYPPYTDWIFDDAARLCLLDRVPTFVDPVARATGWMALWEEMLDGRLATLRLIEAMLAALPRETVEQVVHLVLACLREAFWRFLPPSTRRAAAGSIERTLLAEIGRNLTTSLRSTYFAAFRSVALSETGIALLERIWRREDAIAGLPLSEADEATLAVELGLRDVPAAGDIVTAQLDRFADADRRERFAFSMPALAPDSGQRRAFFETLAEMDGRRRQPWVVEAVTYLNHPLRAESAEVLLRLALERLEAIRETGDIFYAKAWMTAALSGHRTRSAADIVRRFLDARANYPLPLRRIVLQCADPLFRAAAVPQ